MTRSEKVVAANGPCIYDGFGENSNNFRLLELLSYDQSLLVKLSIDAPRQAETFSPAIKTTRSRRFQAQK